MSATDKRQTRLPPPLLFLLALVIGGSAMTLCGERLALGGMASILGVVIGGLSLLLIAWSVWVFKRAGTSLLPGSSASAMVCCGPYRYSRNPIYLGMAGGILGISLIVYSAAFALTSLSFFIISVYLVIRREEQYLLQRFGEPYRQYLQQTRRWL